ncbi:MAG: bifunctional 5,10-methylenetetrahydrofolate dehydrogenase/5,10-methenyltetrahydrofolate cyclohydrolase [Phycisphaerales bacterium]|nr:bifunctional 5,10-methylenetetrahydrofolate dehydrogenase/5,10-methenyltetrahydrofolate cyclohydrolase [Phycisphaerales bacterium]
MDAAETARIIDGRALADAARLDLGQRVQAMRDEHVAVRLDAVIVTGNAAGSVYAASQRRTCDLLGIDYQLHELPEDSTESMVMDMVSSLNEDDAVHAIMVHLPLPDGISVDLVQSSIDVSKDVEGVNPANIGNVIYGRRSLVPCTALATMQMIESTNIALAGKTVVCVGASRIVGKPVAVLLMQAEATVVSTNVHTPDLASFTREADVVVIAAGVPGLLTGDMIKPGAIVVDVGINRVPDPETGRTRTVGDVDFDSVSQIAGWVSPVPGGVGPMTVAMLLRNTVDSAGSSVE